MTQYYIIKGYDYVTNIFGKCLVFLEGNDILSNIVALQLSENYQIYRIDSDNNINMYRYSIRDGEKYIVEEIFIPTFLTFLNSVTDYFGIKGGYSILSDTCNKYKINA